MMGRYLFKIVFSFSSDKYPELELLDPFLIVIWTVHFKWMNHMVCGLYLNKALILKKWVKFKKNINWETVPGST